MSGYLYGQKDDKYYNWQWLKRSVVKILRDYYVYIMIIIIVFLLFFKNLFFANIFASIGSLLLVQNYVGSIPGLEHLWYIPYIIICYLITPIFNKIYQIISKYNELIYWLILVIILLYLQLIGLVGAIGINVAWLSCYAFGFFMAKRYINQKSQKDRLDLQKITTILVPITIMAVGIRIYFEYITDINMVRMTLNFFNLFKNYSRTLMGIALFLVSLLTLKKFNFRNDKLRKVLDWSDKYSYDIYIVHQIYIRGSLSFIGYTSSLTLDILIIVVLITFSAVILKYLSDLIERILV